MSRHPCCVWLCHQHHDCVWARDYIYVPLLWASTRRLVGTIQPQSHPPEPTDSTHCPSRLLTHCSHTRCKLLKPELVKERPAARLALAAPCVALPLPLRAVQGLKAAWGRRCGALNCTHDSHSTILLTPTRTIYTKISPQIWRARQAALMPIIICGDLVEQRCTHNPCAHLPLDVDSHYLAS